MTRLRCSPKFSFRNDGVGDSNPSCGTKIWRISAAGIARPKSCNFVLVLVNKLGYPSASSQSGNSGRLLDFSLQVSAHVWLLQSLLQRTLRQPA